MTDLFIDVPAFCAVVEAGGFSAAGRRLHLSRSAVGKAIARLEHRLHVRLFHRTTRSQSLTEAGQAFYEYCKRASAELQAGKALLESGHTTVTGRLRVSLPVLFGRLRVAPILLQLAEEYPKLELDLDFSDRLAELSEDRFDLAIRMGAVGDSPGLTVRRVATERLSTFAGPGYLARHGRPSCLADLTHHQAIVYGRHGRVQAWTIPGQGSEPQTMHPQTRLCFNDLGAILDAAVGDFGIAWLPDWLVGEQVRSGTLVPILAEVAYHVAPVHAVWLETPYLPRRIRCAIDAIVAGLS